ncbi:MAG: hypothetical protein H6891_01405 [Brucellaceae bacterium]|nr:hypothetical protein [Brucellaceae bacterium]
MTISARAENNAGPWFGDHYGINTYAYSQSHSAADCLRHLADLGARAVEMMVYPGRSVDRRRRRRAQRDPPGSR